MRGRLARACLQPVHTRLRLRYRQVLQGWSVRSLLIHWPQMVRRTCGLGNGWMGYDAPGAAGAPGVVSRLLASAPPLAAAAQAWALYTRWRRVGSPAIHCSLVHTMLTLPFVPMRAPCCSATCVSTPQPRCLTCTTGYGGPLCACLTPSNNCNSNAQCRWGVGQRGGLLNSCLAAARPPGLGWIICRGQLPPHTCLSTPAHALPRCRLLQQLRPWQVHLKHASAATAAAQLGLQTPWLPTTLPCHAHLKPSPPHNPHSPTVTGHPACSRKPCHLCTAAGNHPSAPRSSPLHRRHPQTPHCPLIPCPSHAVHTHPLSRNRDPRTLTSDHTPLTSAG